MVRCRSVSPDSALSRRLVSVPDFSLRSLMGPNVVAHVQKFKHLFDRVAFRSWGSPPDQNLSVAGFILRTRSLTCSVFERMIEYISNTRANSGRPPRKDRDVTVIDDRQVFIPAPEYRRMSGAPIAPARRRPAGPRAYRPHPARPAITPMQYRGTGVAFSRAPHARRPVS